MKRIFALIVLLLASFFFLTIFCQSCAGGETLSEKQINSYVRAIYKAEGGQKAKFLYGIRSVRYDSAQEAERICQNTVRNNYKRWVKAGKPYGDFLVFLGTRYAPIGADNDKKNLNRNWVRNVRSFLKE